MNSDFFIFLLSDSVIDRSGKSKHKHRDRHFADDELKELFTLKTECKQECETMEIMKESMKEWKVCTHAALIKTVIPIEDDGDIRVIFQRSVDPKSGHMDDWNIKEHEEKKEEEESLCDGSELNKIDFHLCDCLIIKQIFSHFAQFAILNRTNIQFVVPIRVLIQIIILLSLQVPVYATTT